MDTEWLTIFFKSCVAFAFLAGVVIAISVLLLAGF